MLKRDTKREAILSAASEQFKQYGYRKTSMDDISKRLLRFMNAPSLERKITSKQPQAAHPASQQSSSEWSGPCWLDTVRFKKP